MFFLAIVMCVMCFTSISIGTSSGDSSNTKKFELPDMARKPLLIEEETSGFGWMRVILIILGLLSALMAYQS